MLDTQCADLVHLEDLHHASGSSSLEPPLLSLPSSTGSDKRSTDLEPIVECPSEATGTPDDCYRASRSILPFGTTGKAIEVALHDGPRPTTYASCISTAPPSTTYAFCFAESSAPPSTTYTSMSFPGESTAPPSNHSTTYTSTAVNTSPVVPGSPVSFYLEGRPEQYFGRVRCVSHGKYAVDLVGGGRMAWLEEVTPCGESMLMHAERKHLGIKTSKDSYAEYVTRNKPIQRSQSASVLLGTEYHAGCPVSFAWKGHTHFGRVHRMHGDGSYAIEVAGGGRKVGVPSEDVKECSEDDLAKAWKSKKGTVTRKDAYADCFTRNTQWNSVTWRSNSPSPLLPGTSRRSNSPREPGLSDRDGSLSPGPPPSRSRRASYIASPRGSLSPPRAWGVGVSGDGCTSRGRLPSGHPLIIGQPVRVIEEGKPRSLYGRLRGMAADGTFNVDLVGGMRRTEVREFSLCTEEDLERESKSKCGKISTRMHEYAEYHTRNSTRDDPLEKPMPGWSPRNGSFSPRVNSPKTSPRGNSPRPASPRLNERSSSPRLRGVVITRLGPLR